MHTIMAKKYSQFIVNSILETAASILFDRIFAQNLLNKKFILLRLLFEGGFYERAASNIEVTVFIIAISD